MKRGRPQPSAPEAARESAPGRDEPRRDETRRAGPAGGGRAVADDHVPGREPPATGTPPQSARRAGHNRERDPLSGDPLSRDPPSGKPLPGEPPADSRRSGDPLSGDPLSGHPPRNGPRHGDPSTSAVAEAANIDVDRGVERRHGKSSLVATLILVGVLFVITLAPVAAPVLLGALLAAFMRPLRQALERRLHQRTLVALLLTLGCVLVVLVPLTLTAIAVLSRTAALFASGSPVAHFFAPDGGLQQLLVDHPQLRRFVPSQLGDQVGAAARWAAAAAPKFLAQIADSAISFFLVVLTLFYLVRDGGWIFRRVESALPLEPRHTRAILLEFQRVGRAFIVGTLGTAALQGTVAGIGFWALGLPEPLLLGTLTALVALVPSIGSVLVWGPVAGYLLLTGETTRAIVLAIYGAAIVGTVDNLVRPVLTRGGLSVHPLLVFLGIFGGVATFGLSGLYLGPLCVALFMAVAHIYERELAPGTTFARGEVSGVPAAENESKRRHRGWRRWLSR